jgi:Ca2+-binding EF-hand superfamily protein
MAHFSRGCRSIGLTPEAIYRAADKKRTGEIGIDELKNALRTAKLGLSQAHSNRLAFMAAQKCNGTISYNEWLNLLEIYEIS